VGEFSYDCVRASSGPYAYIPEADGFAFVATDGQALIATSTSERDPSFCASKPEDTAERNLAIPLLIRLDDVTAPNELEIITPGLLSTHRRYLLPELASFTHSFSREPTPRTTNGRVIALHGAAKLLLDSPSSDDRFVSPSRITGAVEFGNAEARGRFQERLGAEVAPGVRSIDLCDLKHLAGSSDNFPKQYSELYPGCKGTTIDLPDIRIRFSIPLGMKQLGADHWGTIGPLHHVVTYLRRPNVTLPASQSDAVPLPELWSRVNWVTFIDRAGSGTKFPVQPGSAFFIESDEILVVFLGTANVIEFSTSRIR
jgi:hypothetical protein